ncbi:uncharacterized protein LOC129570629 isoform X2 [Sitodiplosis mosellana]|uniref:uncharacterized protein LOC129570629 isoform X2 n=1 Tax=Sitodiplosis mosellana TaxID=263140 RepID=UPI002444E3EB|nr:uncharacterized protein LOC129570629 isoform X2 [Sitodiplosis mosellana]
MDKERGYAQSLQCDQDNHDKFCWKCHIKVNIRTVCKKCCRSFHKYCLENPMDRWTCPMCIKLEEAQQASLVKPPNIRLLAFMMGRVLRNQKFKMFEYMGCWKFEPNDNRKIINPIDLNEINANIQSNTYNSLEACIADIEWIHHNCFVYFSENHKFTAAAAKLLQFCTDELSSMKSCATCYEHKYNSPSDWMIRPCEQPHLILWVDIKHLDFWPADKGFNFWPAKLLGIEEDRSLQVVFFGHHEMAQIDTAFCYLYSGQNPNPVNLTSDPRDIAVALEEVESYIKNVCKKFGVFTNILLESVPLRTPFNWQSLSEHLEIIFPGLGNRIHMQDDSVLEVSDDVSLTQYASYDQSIPFDLTNLNGASANRAGGAKNSPVVGAPHVSVYKQNLGKCMKTFSGVFDQVFELNVKLEQNVRAMEEKHEHEVKTLEQRNEYLADQIEKLKKDMKNELELMEKAHRLKENSLKQEQSARLAKLSEEQERQWASKLRCELQSINNRHVHEIALQKAEYEKKIADLEAERTKLFMDNYDLIEQKNEERNQAVEQARKQCKEEYGALIEDAKGKTYCIACGVGKPLDLFYVCDKNCQRRYCEKKF